MAKPIITTGEGEYFLTVDGESSESVPYGTPLEVELAGENWLCFVDLPEGKTESSDTEAVLNEWLYKVTPVPEDDIEFEEEDEDEDEDAGDVHDQELPVTD